MSIRTDNEAADKLFKKVRRNLMGISWLCRVWIHKNVMLWDSVAYQSWVCSRCGKWGQNIYR